MCVESVYMKALAEALLLIYFEYEAMFAVDYFHRLKLILSISLPNITWINQFIVWSAKCQK